MDIMNNMNNISIKNIMIRSARTHANQCSNVRTKNQSVLSLNASQCSNVRTKNQSVLSLILASPALLSHARPNKKDVKNKTIVKDSNEAIPSKQMIQNVMLSVY
ncbi:uncharacterized protein LOC120909009 isoform X1 [Rana temporaria]|uniref:uncharacterized protein LOC120909009 isoform X1 n=1 Tax=Rana temporaria TaxID=8407 RepID=UPI001AAD5B02|nr:uncharacterized protein LOC120909009 isoform X1 [Rana temporaria]